MTIPTLILLGIAFCVLGMVQTQQPIVTLKPLSWIKPDPKQARKYFGTEEELRRFGEELKRKQLQPLVCLKDGRLVAGERRHRGMLLVGMTHAEVKVLDEDLTETEIRVFGLTDNLQREDLTGPEKWQALLELERLNPTWTGKDMAAQLHLSESMITHLRSPSKCIPAAQEAFMAGKIGIGDCYAISKLAQELQAGLLALKLSGASRDELAAASRKSRNGNGATTTVSVSRIKCEVPGKRATVVVSGEAISLEDMIEAMTDLLKLAKRESEKGLCAKSFERVCKDLAKASQ